MKVYKEEIPLPVVTVTQRVAYAILCALEVPHTPKFHTWAEGWLNGTDRSSSAAWEAWKSSAWEEWKAAEWAAEAAVWAAEWDAEWTAGQADAFVAKLAELSARWASRAEGNNLDLLSIAQKAMEY